MSRNASGNYTLPSPEAPFITRTVVDANDMNTVMSDIGNEITQSLDRNGKGAMVAPLVVPAGTAAAPTLTFTGDTDTGVYNVGANSLGVSLGGTVRATFATTGITTTGTLTIAGALAGATVVKTGDGAVGGPAYSFGSEATSGLYRAGSGDLRVAISGTDRLTLTASQLTIAAALAATSGAFTAGLTVTQSTSNTAGATITGNGTQYGANITGGSSGPGAAITAGGGNNAGIFVTAAGSGTGVDVQGGGTGRGITITPNGTGAPLRIIPNAGDPSSLSDGDIWYNSTTNKLRVRAAGVSVDLH